MKFTMQRDRVVVSTLGHTIEFKKGVAIEVPPILWELVQQHGAVPEEEIPEPEKPKTIVPTDPAERSGLIQLAIESIVTRNRREDFTAGSTPHARVLSDELGWQVSPKERDAEWLKFQQRA
jgi:hypothetical protein